MKNVKFWIVVSLAVDDHAREAVCHFLFSLGALGMVEETARLQAYFPQDIDTAELRIKIYRYLLSLRALGFDVVADNVHISAIPDRDWNAEWKKNYHGFELCDRIYIKPTWEKRPSKAYPCLIEIDPEMAFGTGTHATTKMCLQLLARNIRGGERILDIGTGTGILSIAAVKLGAGRVIAFDLDETATMTAVKNARHNQALRGVVFFTGTLSALRLHRIRPDIILANVNRTEIVNMLPLLKIMSDHPLRLILSGILTEEDACMQTALADANFIICETVQSQEWRAYCAQNRM